MCPKKSNFKNTGFFDFEFPFFTTRPRRVSLQVSPKPHLTFRLFDSRPARAVVFLSLYLFE